MEKLFLLFISMVLGLIIGYVYDLNNVSFFIKLISLIFIYILLIPSILEIDLKKVKKVLKNRSCFYFVLLNIFLFSLFSYVLYLFIPDFALFLSLLFLSLFPTSPTTLYFIDLLHKDINKTASIQINSILSGLFFLIFFVSYLFNLDPISSLMNIFTVLGVPCIITFLFRDKLKKYEFSLRKFSFYALLCLVIISTSLKTNFILNNFNMYILYFLIVLGYYLFGISVSIIFSKVLKSFEKEIIYYTTVPKNISLSFGLCSLISPDSLIYLSCAYFIQISLNIFIYEILSKE